MKAAVAQVLKISTTDTEAMTGRTQGNVRTLPAGPATSLEKLEGESSALQRDGRIGPAGAGRRTDVRGGGFTEFRHMAALSSERGAGAQVVRFALQSRALPMAFDVLRWGELARRSAMSQYGRNNHGAASPSLSGKDAAGTPLTGHEHTFYLPTDEDGDGRLDHLTVWTPGGLTAKEFHAIMSVSALNSGGHREPVQLSYQSYGLAGDFVEVSPLFASSRRWRSLTPYILTRHVKFRGRKDGNGRRKMVDGPGDQIIREVSRRWPAGPCLVRVGVQDLNQPIAPMRKGQSEGFRPFDYFARRQGGGSNGGGIFNFEIEFDLSVSGPLALGYACHQGLGIFVPADPQDG